MMTKFIISIFVVAALFTSCSKIDSEAAPNGDISGKLNDKITNKPLESTQPNGFLVKLFENGGSMGSPISFEGKADGSFENHLIYKNQYKVIPCDGAFFPLDTAIVKVGTQTEINFDVIPFLAVINDTVISSGGTITAHYNITRSQIGDKIVESETMVSSAPTVSDVVFDLKSRTDLSGKSDTDIMSNQQADSITGLTSGQTYYVRIAVRTDNALKRFNYSKVFTVTIK